MATFESIVVIGIGLVGGSLAAAARDVAHVPRVVGIDTDSATRDWAIEHGIVAEAYAPDGAAVGELLGPDGVQLVVLATPARAAVAWIDRLADFDYHGIVTDVASTKRDVLEAATRVFSEHVAFVGGHPMAGSERSGVTAARSDLFDGAYYVLVPPIHASMDAYQRLHAFVTSIGARVISLDAQRHDEAVAVVSHVPHVAASALTNLAAKRAEGAPGLLRLAAGGFKDTTRIAAGSPDLWTGICLDNAHALVPALHDLRRSLDEFSAAVEAGDSVAVRGWLAGAAEVRQALPAQWVPATAALTELSVPVIDRPGQVGEVTSTASRFGCNIEDVEIDHVSEDRAVLRLVLTDEGDIAAFAAELARLGYEPDTRALGDDAPNGTDEVSTSSGEVVS